MTQCLKLRKNIYLNYPLLKAE